MSWILVSYCGFMLYFAILYSTQSHVLFNMSSEHELGGVMNEETKTFCLFHGYLFYQTSVTQGSITGDGTGSGAEEAMDSQDLKQAKSEIAGKRNAIASP